MYWRLNIIRTIYVLLTRSSTLVSRLIGLTTGAAYTHASIAFDPDLDTLCSFARRRTRLPLPAGLIREDLDAGYLLTHSFMPCMVLEAQITDAAYDQAQREVSRMLDCYWEYRYSIRGLAQCRRGVAEKREKYYFCSQFVGEILQNSEAMQLPKPPSLMQPMDYVQMPGFTCVFRGTVGLLAAQVRRRRRASLWPYHCPEIA